MIDPIKDGRDYHEYFNIPDIIYILTCIKFKYISYNYEKLYKYSLIVK